MDPRVEAIYLKILDQVAFQVFAPRPQGIDELDVLVLVGADRAGIERVLSDGTTLYRLYC